MRAFLIFIGFFAPLLNAQTVQLKRVHVLRMGENVETILIQKGISKADFCKWNDCNRNFLAGDVLQLGTATVERKLPPYPKPLYALDVPIEGNEDLSGVYESGYVSIYDELGTYRMANGERYQPNAYVVAHPDLPFGTRLLLTNVQNGYQVYAVVKDRGPLESGTFMEVSEAVAEALAIEEDLYPFIEIRLIQPHEE